MSSSPTPLYYAAIHSHTDACKLLLDRGANSICVRMGSIPIHTLELLLIYRIYTPYDMASYFKELIRMTYWDEDSIELLVRHGVDIDMYHIRETFNALQHIVDSYFRGDDYAHLLCKKAMLLLRLGADPNTIVPRLGWTPLYMAIMADCYDMVELLLEYGADPNIRTPECNKPSLHYANVPSGIYGLLLRYGAKNE